MKTICEKSGQAESVAAAPAPQSEDNFKELSLVSLVALITGSEIKRGVAADAKKEFSQRFFDRIKVLAKNWEKLDSTCNLDAYINETFNRFYLEARRFNWPDEPTPEIIDKVISDWLIQMFIKLLPLTLLVAALADPETSPDMTDQAQKEFHRRFYHRIQGFWKKWEHFGSRYDLDAHTNKTFESFFENAGTLKWPDDLSPVYFDKIISTWLFTTFERQIKEFQTEQVAKYNSPKAIDKLTGRANDPGLYKKKRNVEPKKKNSKKSPDEPSKRDKQLTIVLDRLEQLKKLGAMGKLVLEFRESLNDKNRYILQASLSHYNAYSGLCEIPDEKQEAICTKLDITRKSFRERRSRLTTKWKEFIAAADLKPPEPLSEAEEKAKLAMQELCRKYLFLSKYESAKWQREYENKRNHPKAIDPEVLSKFTI